MKILAIWDRHKAAPNSRRIFALIDDGRFLEILPETEYIGTDAEGKRKYKDTGNMAIWNAFTENEDDRFDFDRADFFMGYFSGELLARWS